MRLFARFALVALSIAAPFAARADLPPTWTSTIPAHVVLVGHGPAGPDSATGHCVVTVRDLANYPVPGSVVTFDFSACGDMAPAADQHDPRLAVNCEQGLVSAVTDANGNAHFTVIGAAVPGTSSLQYCFRIYADGVLLGSPRLATLERDGAPGLTALDLSAWTLDFFTGTQHMRADLNGDGDVSALDLSTWAAAYFNGANTAAIGSVCP